MEARRSSEPVEADCSLRYTDHAMLVIWGKFAQQFGLLNTLLDVPVRQKTVEHSPQTKLVQLLVATLAGCAHLQDMAKGPHPLVRDGAVAEAWGQAAWADPSGVSRTFQAADERTAAATLSVLQQFSQPFIDREVLLAIRQEGYVCYDGDLTGREVSPTSQGYPGAAFGWMGDHVGLGYQAAVVSLQSASYGRLLLTAQRHPGDTVSVACVQELVRAAEAATGVRPRRRSELVAQRLQALTVAIAAQQEAVRKAAERLATAGEALTAAGAVAEERATVLEVLLGEQQPCSQQEERPARPYGRLAKAHSRQVAAVRRVERQQREMGRAAANLGRQQQALAELVVAQTALGEHLARLEADNATNAAPIRAVFRLDAGFGSGPNLTWLIEMGYDVYTKAHNAQVTAGLLAAMPAAASWQGVGKNAEMWVQTAATVSNCAYPLHAAVERFHTGETVRHGTLLHYGSDTVATDATGWFQRYNARQTVEAGIKENKGVFQMRHLKLRSPAGLALAEAFAVFAANLVRWAAQWLAQTSERLPAPFAINERPVNVKQLVRTAANTSAWVTRQPAQGLVVSFTDRSPFAGMELAIGCGGGFQPPLPLLKSVQIPPTKTIYSLVAQ